MAFVEATTQCHHAFPSCGVCGCDEVDVDYVEEQFVEAQYVAETTPGASAAYALELGECPRCEHRWTRPLRLATRREAQRAATVSVLQQDAIPNAA